MNLNYKECIKWLFESTLVYQLSGKNAYKPGINGIKKLCNYLGNPQNFFQSIHIAGTNGKGSTAHMIASIMYESGYNTGLFTSPHFNHFYERIQYNGNYIEKDFIIEFINNNKDFLSKEKYSFFEITTSLAFTYFKYKNVDIAIIETGMGGRLDSTNIILPIISIITHIGIDHIDILGKTLNKIAYEKSGIIKYKTPVIIGPNVSGTEKIFSFFAKKQNSEIFFSKKIENKYLYNLPLIGYSQILNQSTVLKSVKILRNYNIKISENNLKNGFNNVLLNTNFKGRWHCLNKNPKIFCDIAHNEDSIKLISNQIRHESYKILHLVLGFVKGRNIIKLLSYFPIEANYYFCQPKIPRKLDINIIKKLTKNKYTNSKYFSSVEEAFNQAKKESSIDDFIFLGGSTFVVSEIL